MYTNEELINKIKDIILHKPIVDNDSEPKVRNLRTGVTKTVDYPSRLSMFDVFIPSKTYSYTTAIAALKTDHGFVVAVCDITINNNDIGIKDLEQTEFIYDSDSLYISNIEPLERKITYILTPELLEIITPKDVNENIFPLSDFHFKHQSGVMYDTALDVHRKLDNLISLIERHSLADENGAVTLKLTKTKERRVLPSLVHMTSKNKLIISETWCTNVNLTIDLDKKTITDTHSDILAGYAIITDYVKDDRYKIDQNSCVIDKESFKGTYLESFIYEDMGKTIDLLWTLTKIHTIKNIEQILKIIKDNPDIDIFIKLIDKDCDITDILKHKNFYTDMMHMITNECIYEVTAHLRNKISKDLIIFTANLMNVNNEACRNLYTAITEHNLQITPLIKSLYKTISKIEKKFVNEPNIRELLTNIKSNNVNLLKTKLNDLCNTSDVNTRQNKITEIIFEPKLTEFEQMLTNKDFIKSLSDKTVSVTELIHKINKITEEAYHNGRCHSLFNYYIDMMNMCIQINKAGISVIIPKKLALYDIIKLHDDFTNIIDKKQAEINEKAFLAVRTDYLKYEFTDETFSMVVPETAEDLYKEGACLKHCVASYIDRFINRKSAILFIRRNNDLNKPFYTMEINPTNDTIVQVRGNGNRSMTDDVALFVNKINKTLKKTV